MQRVWWFSCPACSGGGVRWRATCGGEGHALDQRRLRSRCRALMRARGLHHVQMVADAGHEFDVVGGEVGELALHQLRRVAEPATGFASPRLGERRFGCERRVCERVEPALVRFAASDEAEAFRDQRNHEQPDAREHSREGEHDWQQPSWNAAFVLHGRNYAAGSFPADLATLFPPGLWRKLLIGLAFVNLHRSSANNGILPNSAPRAGHQPGHSRPRCATARQVCLPGNGGG